MSFAVYLTNDAARDLEKLVHYIGKHDEPAQAYYVMEKIEAAVSELFENPRRSAYVQELIPLGIRDYREIFFKPYRIIYRVDNKTVYGLLIADGRRDLKALLERRLLEA
jgi:toxin ParE1/3/4